MKTSTTKKIKTSIKPMLNIRKDSLCDRYTLIIQLIRERKRGVIFTPYRLQPEEFDARKERAVATNQRKAHREFIREVNQFLQKQIEEIERILVEIERSGKPYNVNDITLAYRQRYDNRYVRTFFRSQIARLRQEGSQGTADNYHATLTAFEKFAGTRRIHFDSVDEILLSEFEKYLRSIPLKQNTITFYMSNFRAVYNKAQKMGYVSTSGSPFEVLTLSVEKTRKLAVGMSVIRKVASAKLNDSPTQSCGRDLFMFSFYCRGMSFVDMAYLRHEDIRDGIIYYRRRKTGQLFTVRTFPALQQIIDRYKELCYPWVLPVMLYSTTEGNIRPMVFEGTTAKQRREFEAALYLRYKYSLPHYLRYLERLGIRLKLEKKLSFNVARHSWATLARDKGIPVSVISAGLGHTTEKTTQIYLDELDNVQVHQANEKLAGMLETDRKKRKKQD